MDDLLVSQLPVVVIIVPTVDGVGAVPRVVEHLRALAGGGPGGAEPLHGGEDPPDSAEKVETGQDGDGDEEEEGAPDHAALAVLVLLIQTQLAPHQAGPLGGQEPPLDVGQAGQRQQEGDQPAQRQQQGGGRPGVLGEQQLAVSDEITSEQGEQTQMRGQVLNKLQMSFKSFLMS